MYPGITAFREEIADSTRCKGYTHVGLGCRLYSNDVDNDIRTIFNANSQFFSILTLLAINKMHSLIDEAGLGEDIMCISTIYDSIYYLVKDDATTVKWLNDALIPTMCVQVFEDELVHNEADLEIGKNWCSLHTIKNDSTLEEVEKVMKEVKDD